MLILGINTAFSEASLAVARLPGGRASDARLLAEIFINGSQPKSEALILDIKKLLTRLNLKLKNIEVISVVAGPGSYTGLRMGITTAKTMAQVLKTKIVTVDSLENLAFQARSLKGLLVGVIKATRTLANLALFTLKSGKIQRLTADLIIEEDKIIKKFSRLSDRFYLAGNASNIYDKIKEMNPKSPAVLLDNPAVIANSAAAVALGGFEKARRGDYQKNILQLAPFYLHPVRTTSGGFKYQFQP